MQVAGEMPNRPVSENGHRHNGPEMLITAVAVMSAIVLRRLGATGL